MLCGLMLYGGLTVFKTKRHCIITTPPQPSNHSPIQLRRTTTAALETATVSAPVTSTCTATPTCRDSSSPSTAGAPSTRTKPQPQPSPQRPRCQPQPWHPWLTLPPLFRIWRHPWHRWPTMEPLLPVAWRVWLPVRWTPPHPVLTILLLVEEMETETV